MTESASIPIPPISRIRLPLPSGLPIKPPIPSPNQVSKGVEDIVEKVSVIPASLSDITSLGKKILSNLTSLAFWQRAGVFLLGGWLIWLGLVVIIGNTRAVKDVVKGQVSTAVKVAKVAA